VKSTIAACGFTLALVLATTVHAGETRVWELATKGDFAKGELAGVLLSSDGELMPGLALTRKGDLEADGAVWSWTLGPAGELYLGTGNKGAILRMRKGGALEKFAETGGLFVTALAWHAGKLHAGIVPGGRVVAIDAAGKVDTVARLADPYPWALVPLGERLLVASGPSGMVHAVDEKGALTVVFDAGKGHVLALAAGEAGSAYAGTDQGTIWRIALGEKPADKPTARVVAHVDGVEIKALSVDATAKVLFAAANRCEKLKQADFVRELATSLESARDSGQTDRKNVIEEGFQAELFRVEVDSGRLDTLATFPKELALALAVTAEGVYLGGGADGRVYVTDPDRRSTVLFDLDEPQASALVVVDGTLQYVASGSPGRLYAVGVAPAADSSYTSAVHDAGHVARWGRIAWTARGKITIKTRSGFTPEPDRGWSDWQAVSGVDSPDGARPASPPGRYIQLQVTFGESSASLAQLSLHYRAYNQRPRIDAFSVTAASGGGGGGESESDAPATAAGSGEGSDAPPKTDASARPLRPGDPAKALAIAWQASDQDGDVLRIALHYRRLGDTEWRAIETPKPLEGPQATAHNWETQGLPDGYYYVRVTASDSPSNPAADVLSDERTLDRTVLVDHGTPRIEAIVQAGGRLACRAVDSASPIARVEYSWDGGAWHVAPARDGIYDSAAEGFEIPTEGVAKGRRALSLKAIDAAGNVALERVWVALE